MKTIHDRLTWCGACRSFRAAQGRENSAVCVECESLVASQRSKSRRRVDFEERRDLSRDRFYTAQKRRTERGRDD